MPYINEFLPKEPGVYFITDPITGKSYVGSSSNLEMRRRHHAALLKTNSHYNQELQESYNQHRQLEIVYATVEDKELAETMEQTFLDEYFPSGVLMNRASRAKLSMLSPEIQNGNTWALGRVITPEMRKKISESNKGKVLTDEHKQHLKDAKKFPVLIDGVEYRNAHDAASQIGISHDVVKNRIKNPNYPGWKKLF